jgi:protein-disulfide isomerase
MKVLKSVFLASLATFALSLPVFGQSVRSTRNSSNSNAQLDTQRQTQGNSRLPADLSQPIEIDQSQVDRFFPPAQQQRQVDNQTTPSVTSDSLITPPPGSVTPEQETPNRLQIPIR